MVSIDEHTQVAMEIVSQGTRLSEELLLKVMQALTDLLVGNDKGKHKSDFVIKSSTKEGKQKINDLVNKHKDGVVALDENITKQQLNDYQKELKKLGVDFSVVKNGKDSYSFFFSGQQANIIEKALKNIVERKSNVLENEEVKNLQTDLNGLKEELPKEKVLEVKNLYDKTATPEQEDKKSTLNEQLNNLSSKEKLLFSKLKELDDLKRTLYIQEIKRVESLYNQSNNQANEIPIKTNEVVIDDSLKGKDKSNSLGETNTTQSPEERLQNVFNQLTPKEQSLFMQINSYEIESLNNAFADKSSYRESDALENLEKGFSEADIKKVNSLYKENVFNGLGEAPEGKLHADEISKVSKNLNKEQQAKKTSPSIFSMEGVKELDTKIKMQQQDQAKDKKREQSLAR